VNISQRPLQKPAAQQAAREFTPKYGIAAKTLGETGRSARHFRYASLCCWDPQTFLLIHSSHRSTTNTRIFHTGHAHRTRTHKRHDSAWNRHDSNNLRRITRDTCAARILDRRSEPERGRLQQTLRRHPIRLGVLVALRLAILQIWRRHVRQ
jgi:hypothetical protein